jgi:hypothetical protein
MAERLKAAVLKTVNGVTRSGVRIPLPPPPFHLPRELKSSWSHSLPVFSVDLKSRFAAPPLLA